MTDSVVGRIGNLSETGMLLIASVPLTDDALYQFRFQLPGAHGPRAEYEVGAHLLWQDGASAPGQAWTGFRFIAIPPGQADNCAAGSTRPGGNSNEPGRRSAAPRLLLVEHRLRAGAARSPGRSPRPGSAMSG